MCALKERYKLTVFVCIHLTFTCILPHGNTNKGIPLFDSYFCFLFLFLKYINILKWAVIIMPRYICEDV